MIGDVAVIKLAANHLDLKLVKDYTARTNTIRGIKIQVDFRTRDWDNLAKTVVFNSKNISAPILVQMEAGEDFVDIPWEIMAIANGDKVDKKYTVGVFGVSAGGAQLPTNMLELTMMEGCYFEGVASSTPTPSIFSQMLAIQQDTANIAQGVRDDADAGKFKGEKGDKGDPGEDGAPGKDGLSAYEIWLNNGHEGTEEDFLESLKCDELSVVFDDVVATIGCGGVSVGTSLKGKTVRDVLAMILGIQDKPQSAVDYIMSNQMPLYRGLAGGELVEVAYQQLDTNGASHVDQGFYITRDKDEITNAGYQVVFEGNTENIAQMFALCSNAKIVTAYQYQPVLNQWLNMGFDGTYWIETGTSTKSINGQEVIYTTYSYNTDLMGDVITATEYWRFEVEVL